MRTSAVWCLALLLGASPLGAGAEAGDPAAEAEARLRSVLAGIDAVVAHEEASPEQKQASVVAALLRWVDFASMSRRALGDRFESFSRVQFASFSQEFTRYIGHAFLRDIARHGAGEEIQGSSWNAETGTATIRAAGRRPVPLPGRIVSPDTPTVVEYRLRMRHGDWRIVSVSNDGIDLVETYRAQFQDMLDGLGPEDLTQALRERNDERSKQNPFQ